jgi:hypothetical protein
MSIICKDCGGIFNKPCFTFNNNNSLIMPYNHYQTDTRGVLFPVLTNFMGIECWLNDNTNNGYFIYHPTIELLKKLKFLPKKTYFDIQIFKEITQLLDQKYIINLDYGINLLNYQISTNSINLQGHTNNYTGIIPKWVKPLLNPVLIFPLQQYYYMTNQLNYQSNYQSNYQPNYQPNYQSYNNPKAKPKTKKSYSDFKPQLSTINE